MSERFDPKDVMPLSSGFVEILRKLAIRNNMPPERATCLLRIAREGRDDEVSKARERRDLRKLGAAGKLAAQRLSQSDKEFY